MKKSLITILLILSLSCMMFVSCNPEVSNNTPSEPVNTVTQSLKGLEAGGSITLENVGEDTEINLSDFSLEDGVYIEIVNSKGKAIGASKKVESDVLFQRQDGSIIPIPDENGKIKIKGKDLGIGNGSKIVINKLHNPDIDLSISYEEYKNQIENENKHVAEEYYYIDIRERNLKSSEIVLVESGFGAHGVRLLQRGFLNSDINGVLNLSSYKESGFAINMYLHFQEGFTSQKMVIHVLNPIDIKHTSVSNPYVLDKDVNVIKVAKNSSNQKVVIQFDDSSVIRSLARSVTALITKPRYLDGTQRPTDIIPEYNLGNKTITYHLGVVEDDFIFNLDWENIYTPGTATIYLSNDDWNGFTDITNLTSTNITSQAGEIVTWAFKTDKYFNIHVENALDENCTFVHYNGNMRGSGVGNLREFLFSTDHYGDISDNEKFTGYILLDCFDKPTNPNAITLENAENLSITCKHVVWDQSSHAYKCTDCNKLYTTKFIDACRENIFKGNSVDEENNKFGIFSNICHDIKYLNIKSIEGIPSHGTGGTDEDGRYYEGTILSDGTERWIECHLIEIIQEDNGVRRFVYDVYSYENPSTPISITLTHTHDWNWNDLTSNNIVSCKNCSEQISANTIMLSCQETDGFAVSVSDAPVSIYVPSTNELFIIDEISTEPLKFDPLPEGITTDVPVYVYTYDLSKNVIINSLDDDSEGRASYNIILTAND